MRSYAFFLVLAACSSSSSGPTKPVDAGSDVQDAGQDTAPPYEPPPPPLWLSVVGAGGTFAQTFDDKTWATRTIADRALYSVTCVGNLRGWAAGERGYVAHTEDGGASWALQAPHLGADLRAIRFGTPTIGVVAG